MNFKDKLDKLLYEQIDNSQLVVFRVFFGLLIFLESGGAILTGWVKEVFVDAKVPLQFIGFEWLRPLSGYGMYWYYGIMALLGLMVMAGLFYKASLSCFTVLWLGCYLMQKSHYNNHYYLLILLCFLMLLVPAHRYFSLDVKRKPTIKSHTYPRWCVFIFLLQLWIVFSFASIAKIQPDWLEARPISIWFSGKADYPIVGDLFQLRWFQLFIAYGGVFFDGLIVPLLLWKRTRVVGLVLCIFFNLFNSIVFQIGIFPYLMIVMTIFFFPPEKIKSIFFPKKPGFQSASLQSAPLKGQKRFVTYLLGIYFIIQIVLPLRHLLFPGNVNWTEEGHRMSWRMMLRTKSGYIEFYTLDRKTGKGEPFILREHFTKDQIDEIAKRPDMAWQAAQYIKNFYKKKGSQNIEVYANSNVSLNGRPLQPLINSKVNLAAVKWSPFQHSDWILPFVEEKSEY
jgi:vitamin K-dependent gamma-carboxylase